MARSAEAKALGIPMGAPEFKLRARLQELGVAVFSSNYALYGDISARVTAILEQCCPLVEPYSIDEAFMRLDAPQRANLPEFCRHVRQRVQRWTGITVSVGVGTTRTLAKVATHVARTDKVLRPRNRHDGGDSGTPAAQGARAGQRPHGKYDLVGFVIGLGFGRNFVPKNLVAQARAANDVKIFVGVLNSDAARAQVDPQALALIAAEFSGHKFLQLANGA